MLARELQKSDAKCRQEVERETGIEPGDIQLGKLAFYFP
jgi:hypothetical protein